jgi:hypothetical protein
MTPPESSLGFLLSGISVGSSAPRFFSLRQQISAPIYHRELNAEYLPRSLDLRRSARARAFQRRSLYPAGGDISADCTKRAPSRELERLYVLGGRRVKGVCGTFLFGKSHAYISDHPVSYSVSRPSSTILCKNVGMLCGTNSHPAERSLGMGAARLENGGRSHADVERCGGCTR